MCTHVSTQGVYEYSVRAFRTSVSVRDLWEYMQISIVYIDEVNFRQLAVASTPVPTASRWDNLHIHRYTCTSKQHSQLQVMQFAYSICIHCKEYNLDTEFQSTAGNAIHIFNRHTCTPKQHNQPQVTQFTYSICISSGWYNLHIQ